MPQDLSRRTSFNSVVENYHASRPHYPEALFDTLVAKAGLTDDAKLLEIGPGTGHATEPLARRGFDIAAVELGAKLADKARETLSQYPNVRIVVGAFETMPLATNAFDLVYAASAFHWIEPAAKFSKPHALLKSGGHLAIIRAAPISDEAGDAFFHASQPVYKKYTPGSREESIGLLRRDELKPAEVDGTLFTVSSFDTFPVVFRYSAKEYVALLGTYSPTIAMEPDRRAGFLGDMKSLIENEFGGRIERHMSMNLTIALRRD